MFTADSGQRVNALAKAMHWFDRLQAYLAWKNEGKWTLNQLRARKKAEDHRYKGIKETNDKEKIKHFLAAIHQYEFITQSYKPPLVKNYISDINKQTRKFHSRREKMTSKHGKFLKLMENLLQPFAHMTKRKIHLYVDRINSTYHVHSNGDITYNRKTAEMLRKSSRKYGVFSAVLYLLPQLTEVSARIPEIDLKGHKTGRTICDKQLRFTALLEMLKTFNANCQASDAPRTIIRRAKKETE